MDENSTDDSGEGRTNDRTELQDEDPLDGGEDHPENLSSNGESVSIDYTDTEFDPEALAAEFSEEAAHERGGLSIAPPGEARTDLGIDNIQQMRDRAEELMETAQSEPERTLRAFDEVRELLTYPISEERLLPELERRLFASRAVYECLDAEPLEFVPSELVNRSTQVDAYALAEEISETLIEERNRDGFGSAEYTMGKPQANEEIEVTLIASLVKLGTEFDDIVTERFDLLTDCLDSSTSRVQRMGAWVINELAESDVELPDSLADELQGLLTSGRTEDREVALIAYRGLAKQRPDLAIEAIDQLRTILQTAEPSVQSTQKEAIDQLDTGFEAAERKELRVQALRLLPVLVKADVDHSFVDLLPALDRELRVQGEGRLLALSAIKAIANSRPEAVADAISPPQLKNIAFEHSHPQAIGDALLILGVIYNHREVALKREETNTLIEYLSADDDRISQGARGILISTARDDPYLLNQVASLIDDDEATQAAALWTLASIANQSPEAVHSAVDVDRLADLISERNDDVCQHTFALLGFFEESDSITVSEEVLDDIEQYLIREDTPPQRVFILLREMVDSTPEMVISSDVSGMLPELLETSEPSVKPDILRFTRDLIGAAPEEVDNPFERDRLYDILTTGEPELRGAAARLLGALVGHDQSHKEYLLDSLTDYVHVRGEQENHVRISEVLTHAIVSGQEDADVAVSLLQKERPEKRIVGLITIARVSSSDEPSISLETLDCTEAVVDRLDGPESVREAALASIEHIVENDPGIVHRTPLVSVLVDRLLAADAEDDEHGESIIAALGLVGREATDIGATEGFSRLVEAARGADSPRSAVISAIRVSLKTDESARDAFRELLSADDETEVELATSILRVLAEETPDVAQEMDPTIPLSRVMLEEDESVAELAAEALHQLAEHDIQQIVEAGVEESLVEALERDSPAIQRRCLAVLDGIVGADQQGVLLGTSIAERISELLADGETKRSTLMFLGTLGGAEPERWLQEGYLTRIREIIEDGDQEIRNVAASVIALYAREAPETVLEHLSVSELVGIALEAREDKEESSHLSVAISEVVSHAPETVHEEGKLTDVVEFLHECRTETPGAAQRTLHELVIENEETVRSALAYTDRDQQTERIFDPDASEAEKRDALGVILDGLADQEDITQRLVTLSLSHAVRITDGSLDALSRHLHRTETEVQIALVDAVGYIAESHPDAVIGVQVDLERLISSDDPDLRRLALEAIKITASNRPAAVAETGVQGGLTERLKDAPPRNEREELLPTLGAVAQVNPDAFDAFTLSSELVESTDDSDEEIDDRYRDLVAVIVAELTLENDVALDPLLVDPLEQQPPDLLGDLLARVLDHDAETLTRTLAKVPSVRPRGKYVVSTALLELTRRSPEVVAEPEVVRTLSKLIEGHPREELEGEDEHYLRESKRTSLRALAECIRMDPGSIEDVAIVDRLVEFVGESDETAPAALETLRAVGETRPSLLTRAETVDPLIEEIGGFEENPAEDLESALGAVVSVDPETRKRVVGRIRSAEGGKRSALIAAVGNALVDSRGVFSDLAGHLGETDCEREERVEIFVSVFDHAAREDPEAVASETTVALATEAIALDRPAARRAGATLLRRVGVVSADLIANESTADTVLGAIGADDTEIDHRAVEIAGILAAETPELLATRLSPYHVSRVIESEQENAEYIAALVIASTLKYSTELQHRIQGWLDGTASGERTTEESEYGDDEAQLEEEITDVRQEAGGDLQPDADERDTGNGPRRSPEKTRGESGSKALDTVDEPEDEFPTADLVASISEVFRENPETVDELCRLICNGDRTARAASGALLSSVLQRDSESIGPALSSETLGQLLGGDPFAREFGLELTDVLTNTGSAVVSDGHVVNRIFDLVDADENEIGTTAANTLASLCIEHDHVKRAVASLVHTGTTAQRKQGIHVFNRAYLENSDDLDLNELDVLDESFELLRSDEDEEWKAAGLLIATTALSNASVRRRVEDLFDMEADPPVYHACGIAQIMAETDPDLCFDNGFHRELLGVLETPGRWDGATRELAMEALNDYVRERPTEFLDASAIETIEARIDDESESVATAALLSVYTLAEEAPEEVCERLDVDRIKPHLPLSPSDEQSEVRTGSALYLLNRIREATETIPLDADEFDEVMHALQSGDETAPSAAITFITDVAIDHPSFFEAVDGEKRLRRLLTEETVDDQVIKAGYIELAKNDEYLETVLSLATSADPEVQEVGLEILAHAAQETEPSTAGTDALVELLNGFDHPESDARFYTNAALRSILSEDPDRGSTEAFVRELADRLDSERPIERKYAVETLLFLLAHDSEQVSSVLSFDELAPLLDDREENVGSSAKRVLAELLETDPPEWDRLVALLTDEDVSTGSAGSAIAMAAQGNPELLPSVRELFEADERYPEENLTMHGLGILQAVAKSDPEAVGAEFTVERVVDYIDRDASDRDYAITTLVQLLADDPANCRSVLEAYESGTESQADLIEHALKLAAQRSEAVRDELRSVLEDGSDTEVGLVMDALKRTETLNSNPKLSDVGGRGDRHGPVTVGQQSIETVTEFLTHEDEAVREAAGSCLRAVVDADPGSLSLGFALQTVKEILAMEGIDSYEAASKIVEHVVENDPEKIAEHDMIEFLIDTYATVDEDGEICLMRCLKEIFGGDVLDSLDEYPIGKTFELVEYESKHALNAWILVTNPLMDSDLSLYAEKEHVTRLLELLERDYILISTLAYKVLLQLGSTEPELLYNDEFVERLWRYLSAEDTTLRWRSTDLIGSLADSHPESVLDVVGDQILTTLDAIVVEVHGSSEEQRRLDADDFDAARTVTDYPGIFGLAELLSVEDDIPPLTTEVYVDLLTDESERIKLRSATILNRIGVKGPEQLRPHHDELRRLLREEVEDSAVQKHLFETLREAGSEPRIRGLEDLADPIHDF